jgi:hypothetical protein
MLPSFDQVSLSRGAHPRREDGLCAMELVAWMAGEPHTDEPQCACPVIAAYVRALNDALPDDATRTRLLTPLVPTLLNTRGVVADERRRGMLVVDAMVRRFVPHALRRTGRCEQADALAGLHRVRDLASTRMALRALEAWAPEQSAARWVLQRAVEGSQSLRFVAGAIQVVRRVGDATAWQMAADLATDLALSTDVAPMPVRAAEQTFPAESASL